MLFVEILKIQVSMLNWHLEINFSNFLQRSYACLRRRRRRDYRKKFCLCEKRGAHSPTHTLLSHQVLRPHQELIPRNPQPKQLLLVLRLCICSISQPSTKTATTIVLLTSTEMLQRVKSRICLTKRLRNRRKRKKSLMQMKIPHLVRSYGR